VKNVMIYIARHGYFNDEHEKMAKVQIDMMLELGWKCENIVILTNFDFQYNGVKAWKWDVTPLAHASTPEKLRGLIHLIENRLITEPILFHDFDAFHCDYVDEIPEEYKQYHVSSAQYFHRIHWNTGIMFIQPTFQALDILHRAMAECFRIGCKNEESAFMNLFPIVNDSNPEVGYLSVDWNIGKRSTVEKFRVSETPRVIHFHPKPKNYDYYCLGKNEGDVQIATDLMCEQIKKHFNY
jgi:hypothetical protein